MPLNIKILTATETKPYLDAMWTIYHRYYEFDKETMIERVEHFYYNVLFFHNTTLVGFTGVVLKRGVVIENKKYTLIGLGQTIIQVDYRNQNFIQHTCSKLFLQEQLRNPFAKIFLWTLAGSYKPYLIFSQHIKIAYPTLNCTQTNESKAIIEHIGQHYLPSFCQYIKNEGIGIIQMEKFITDETVKVKPEDLQNPHIAYFQSQVKKGESYLNGQEGCVCVITIAPANWANLLYWAGKMVKKKFKKLTLLNKKNADYPTNASNINN